MMVIQDKLSTTINLSNIWLVRKAFKEYGFNDQDVIRNILEELKNLRNRLEQRI